MLICRFCICSELLKLVNLLKSVFKYQIFYPNFVKICRIWISLELLKLVNLLKSMVKCQNVYPKFNWWIPTLWKLIFCWICLNLKSEIWNLITKIWNLKSKHQKFVKSQNLNLCRIVEIDEFTEINGKISKFLSKICTPN
jgi:hypothetical protein